MFRRGNGVPHDGGRAARHAADAGARNRWSGPVNANLDAARRLIARHGMPLVLAVGEWASPRLPRPTRATLPANRMTVSGVASLTGPALARHWDQVCLQMADDPHGRRLLAEHGVIADKGELAQPPSAASMPKVPNYGIPDNLDRRVWKLLDPYGFDAGNDGFEAPRTLRRLLKASPRTMPKANAMPCWRHCERAKPFLDAESREKDDGFGRRKPAETGPASVRFWFYRRPWAEGGAGMFLKGECAGFPRLVVGPHVGPDDPPNQRTLIRTAACGGAGSARPARSGPNARVRHHGPGPVRHLRRTAVEGPDARC